MVKLTKIFNASMIFAKKTNLFFSINLAHEEEKWKPQVRLRVIARRKR